MRKHLLSSALTLSLLCLLAWSCAKKNESPESVAEQFYNTLYNEHELEKAEALVTSASKEKLHEDFKYIEGTLAVIAAEQDVHYTFKALTEKTYSNNDSTFVFIWTSLDSSTYETLLFNEAGAWKVDFRYPANKSPKKALTEDVLEVMSEHVEQPVVQKTPAKN